MMFNIPDIDFADQNTSEDVIPNELLLKVNFMKEKLMQIEKKIENGETFQIVAIEKYLDNCISRLPLEEDFILTKDDSMSKKIKFTKQNDFLKAKKARNFDASEFFEPLQLKFSTKQKKSLHATHLVI